MEELKRAVVEAFRDVARAEAVIHREPSFMAYRDWHAATRQLWGVVRTCAESDPEEFRSAVQFVEAHERTARLLLEEFERRTIAERRN